MRAHTRALLLGGFLLATLELLAHGSVLAPLAVLDGLAGGLLLADLVRSELRRRRMTIPLDWETSAPFDAWSESEFDADDETELDIDWPEFERAFAAYARNPR